MRNRIRLAAQPMLESMEARVVPSAMGIGPHHERAVASHISQVNTSANHPSENQRAMNTALKHLQQQLALIQTRSLEHTPSAEETPAQKAKSATSSFFKSVMASL